MSSSEVSDWLRKNNLEELVDTFERHKLTTFQRLKLLRESHVSELICEVGLRMDFLHALKEFHREADSLTAESLVQSHVNESQNKDCNVFMTDEDGNRISVVEVLQSAPATTEGLVVVSDVPLNVPVEVQHYCESEPSCSYEGPLSKRRKDSQSSSEIQLQGQTADSGWASDASTSKSSSRSSGPLTPWSGRSNEQHNPSSSSRNVASYSATVHMQNLDLRAHLKNCNVACEAVLENFDLSGALTDSDRATITTAVAYEILKHNYVPLPGEYQAAAKKICELFPCESEDVYYCPSDESHRNAFGRLPHKVKNLKYTLKKKSAGTFVSTVSVSPSLEPGHQKYTTPAKLSGSLDKDNEEVQRAIAYLKYESHDSVPELLRNWSLTHAIRRHALQNSRPQTLITYAEDQDDNSDDETEEESVSQYYKVWTVLTLPTAYQLLDQDFSELFPGREDALLSRWDSTKALIFELVEKEVAKSDGFSIKLIKDYKSAAEDKQDVILLHLLPVLCYKGPRVKNVSTGTSLVEVRKSFILHVHIPGDINRAVKNHSIHLKNLGLSLQPFLIVVGPSLASITASYVQVDQVRYQLRTTLKALDICFKAFFSLDAEYPARSKSVWLLIQKFLYGINLKEDEKITKVTSTISSLKGLLSKRRSHDSEDVPV